MSGLLFKYPASLSSLVHPFVIKVGPLILGRKSQNWQLRQLKRTTHGGKSCNHRVIRCHPGHFDPERRWSVVAWIIMRCEITLSIDVCSFCLDRTCNYLPICIVLFFFVINLGKINFFCFFICSLLACLSFTVDLGNIIFAVFSHFCFRWA